MILNIVLIVFVLSMAMMWSTYGLFSALLHLGLVIVAGSLAFALWEPLAYGVFFKFLPTGAWGVSLLGSFVVVLLLLRVVTDKFVRGTLKVHRLADQVGGGAAGAASGVLTAGVTLLGLGFLPLPPAIASYQPYEVKSNGRVGPVEGGGLWLPADTIAANLFTRLSGGAFSTHTPLVSYVPNIAEAATLFRLGRTYDENLSVVSAPGGVTANATALLMGDQLPGIDAGLAQGLLGAAGSSGRLVTVVTQFTKGESTTTYDADGILRLPATNIRLATRRRGEHGQWVAPVGFSKPGDSGRTFYALANNQMMASSRVPNQEIAWHFVVPSDREPDFLLVRNTRVLLPSVTETEPADYAALIGNPDASGGVVETASVNRNRSGGVAIDVEPSAFASHKAVYIEQSADLPSNVSKNNAQFLTYNETAVVEGQGLAQSGSAGRNTTLSSMQVSPALRGVRVEMELVRAANDFSALAQGAGAASVQDIWLSDTQGQSYRPFGYVLRKDDGRQLFRVLSGGELRSNVDLPLNDFVNSDRLYVYWQVPPGTTLNGYHIGGAAQDFNFAVN